MEVAEAKLEKKASEAPAAAARSVAPAAARAVELGFGGVPVGVSSNEEKLTWLHSQIIGREAEFESPFGRRRLTYADHTASGRCLRYIEDFIVDNLLPSYGNTHTSDNYTGHRTTKMVEQATKYVKQCLGGGPDTALLFCGSGSTGAIKRLQEVIGISVPSTLRDRVLRCLADEERWVVFLGPFEHHSNLLSWRQSLAEVVEIGTDREGLLDMEALREKLRSFQGKNRPMLGSFSACSNVTGIRSDTRAISELLHRFGAFACFDFAASGPYVEIDMRAGEIDGYDAIFLSPHKFLGGPGSPGVLLMSKALYQLKSSPPSTCAGGTVNYVNGFNPKDTLYIEDIEERENGGTPQIIQTTRAALAFWVKDYVGYETIHNMEQRYIREALNRLLPNQNIHILGNQVVDRLSIMSFLIYTTTNSIDINSVGHKFEEKEKDLYMWRETGIRRGKPLHGPFVATLLNDLFGIQARGGCACAGPYGHSLLGVDEAQSLAIRSAIQKGFLGMKPGWTRVSFPYYMSCEEFEFILAALEFIASFGQRFLPLYHFNLKKGTWTFKKKALTALVGNKNKNKNKTCNFFNNNNTSNHDKNKTSIVVCDYKAYLECAHHVASLLPKFPRPRQLQDEMDPNLMYFYI